MKIYDNGMIRDMTPVEIDALKESQANRPSPEPATEDRLAALEAAVLALMGGGVDV